MLNKLGRIGLVLLALVVLYVAYYLWDLNSTLKDAEATVDKQGTAIIAMEDGAKKTVLSNDVTEKVVAEVIAEDKVVDKKHDIIVEHARQDVSNIQKEFATKPPSDIASAQEIEAVSRRRIESLWEAYCATSQKDNADCPDKK